MGAFLFSFLLTASLSCEPLLPPPTPSTSLLSSPRRLQVFVPLSLADLRLADQHTILTEQASAGSAHAWKAGLQPYSALRDSQEGTWLQLQGEGRSQAALHSLPGAGKLRVLYEAQEPLGRDFPCAFSSAASVGQADLQGLRPVPGNLTSITLSTPGHGRAYLGEAPIA